MKTLPLFSVLVVASWVMLTLGPVHAQCVVFGKPDAAFASSEAVFLGTLVAREPTGAQGAHVIVEVATFRVDRAWKGEPGPTILIGADRPFEKGKQWVVFAGGKPLSTSILCRWAEPIEEARAKLDWLLKRQLPNRPLQPTSGGTIGVE